MNKRLRLSVFRSHHYIYAQIIDDQKGHTLISAWGKDSNQVGQSLAKEAIKAGIKKVWLDRGHYRYHGRVKALTEGARKGGLQL